MARLPDQPELLERARLASVLAREAGALTMRHFRSPTLKVETKADDSPVTAADKAAEELIRRRLAQLCPDDGVVGEEYDPSVGRSGYTWIIDPIDGTRAFARGIPTFAVLIGLAYLDPREARGGAGAPASPSAGLARHRPVAGAADYPALGEHLWAGPPDVAYPALSAPVTPDLPTATRWVVDGFERPARVGPGRALDECLIESSHPGAYRSRGLGAVYERLVDRAHRVHGWHDAYAFALVATGRAEAAVDLGIRAWDIAPFFAIMAGAGGFFTDWTGRARLDADRVVAAHPALLPTLTSLLAN